MKNIAFVFPGQGSQYIGMGRTLADNFLVAKKVFEEAKSFCGYDVLDFCDNDSYRSLINSPKALVALLVVTIAAFRVLKAETMIQPKYLAGYSFGELSALVASDAISFEDALKISMHKGKSVQSISQKIKSAMTAIDGVDCKMIERECRRLSNKNKFLNIAVFNSNTKLVVSGDVELVEKLEKILKKQHIIFNRLEIEAPFHSPYFKKAATKAKKELSKYNIKKPSIPIVSSLSASILNNKKEIVNSLSQHLVQPVRWRETIEYLRDDTQIIIEVGPKRILSSVIENMETYSFSSPKDLPLIQEKFNLSKKDILDIMGRCMGAAMSVRNFNVEEKGYKEKVIKPYQGVKKSLLGYRENKKEPSIVDVIDAFEMLRSVLAGKMVDIKEAEEVIKRVYYEYPKLVFIYKLDQIWKIKKM
jgi:[acyl-carrier-protein] S-malonyltransferase